MPLPRTYPDLKAGDKFWFEQSRYTVESFDCRQSEENVGMDRGIDAAGNAKRVGCRRISDGQEVRFSEAQLVGVCSGDHGCVWCNHHGPSVA